MEVQMDRLQLQPQNHEYEKKFDKKKLIYPVGNLIMLEMM